MAALKYGEHAVHIAAPLKLSKLKLFHLYLFHGDIFCQGCKSKNIS